MSYGSIFYISRRVYRCLHDLRLQVGVSSIAQEIALGPRLGTTRTQLSELVLISIASGLCS